MNTCSYRFQRDPACDCVSCFRERFEQAGRARIAPAAERRRAHVRLDVELVDDVALTVRQGPALSRAGGGWRTA